MRISDWSSDVCSSDLSERRERTDLVVERPRLEVMRVGCVDEQVIGCLIAKAGAVGRLVRLVQHLDDPGGEVEHAGVQRLPDAEAGIEAAGEGGDEGLLATVPADRKSTRLNSSH